MHAEREKLRNRKEGNQMDVDQDNNANNKEPVINPNDPYELIRIDDNMDNEK